MCRVVLTICANVSGRYISAGLDSIPDAPEVSTHRFATARSKGQRRAAVTSVLPAEDYGFHGEINQSLLRIVRANPNEVMVAVLCMNILIIVDVCVCVHIYVCSTA